MKKVKRPEKEEMRAEYKRSDFPQGFVRGKYAERLRESSNVLMLKPEVTRVLPNQQAVNDDLLSLTAIAKKAASVTKQAHPVLAYFLVRWGRCPPPPGICRFAPIA